MTVPGSLAPDTSDPSPSSLLDQVEGALGRADVAAAVARLDDAALLPLVGVDRIRLRVAEGRLAALAGRSRAATAALTEAIADAEQLPEPAARAVASTARIELVQQALRAGRIRRAAEAAQGLDGTDDPLAALAHAAVRVGSGDRTAVTGIDAAADALLVAHGTDASGRIADTAGLALVWAERCDEADRLLGRLGRLARREADRGQLPNLLAVQSLADLRSNRYRAAAARADESVRLADATDRPGLATLPLAVLAVAEAVRGDADGCRLAAERLAEDAARNGDREVDALAAEVPARAALGLLHLGLDEPELTVGHLEPLLGRAEGTPWLVMWQVDLAEGLVRVGRADAAAALLERFLGALGPDPAGRAPAAAARVQALLVDDHDEAEAHLARSEQALRAQGAPFGVGRTLLVRGALRRSAGRDAEGRTDLEHAEAMLRSVGAVGWAEQAAAARTGEPRAGVARLLGTRSLDAHAAGPLGRPTVLTPQELQVAALVVTGRSNREVADALFISARTVESHLGRIYRKLGVRSRSQLTARADEWGLRAPTW